MPTKKELETLVDFIAFNPAIDAAYFSSTPVDAPFATQTSVANSAGSFWAVNFLDGSSGPVTTTAPVYARCVQ